MNYLPVVAVGFLSAIFYCSSQAQDAHPRVRPQVVEWSWVDKQWTGKATSYIQVKYRIDNAFKNVKQIESVTQKYRVAALAKPTDALAQYAWGYASYVGRPPGVSVKSSELPDIAVALSGPTDPKVYEYSRLRFIVTANWRPYLQLKPLGKRLLQRDPKDYRAKRSMISLLAVSSEAEQQQALLYAQQLVHDYPQKAGAYSSLGWVYTMMFSNHKDAALGSKAIATYRKFIAMSKDPIARQEASRTVDVIQHEQR